MFAVLSKSKFVHQLLQVLGLYAFLNWYLHRRPWKIKRPSGLTVLISSLDGIAIYRDIFCRGEYDRIFQGASVKYYLDLGCNVGLFSLLVVEKAGRDLHGVLVDADPVAIERTRKHLAINQLNHCQASYGCVGLGPEQSEAVFYVYPSSSQSSFHQPGADHPYPVKGQIREIRVKGLRLEEITGSFAGAMIDLVKVDIEGAEFALFRHEREFFTNRVASIIMEWHKYVGDTAVLEQDLRACGFTQKEIIAEDSKVGVAIWRKSSQTVPGTI